MDKNILIELEEKYGEVVYNSDELENADELYFIKVGCVYHENFLEKYLDKKPFSVGEFYDTEIPEIYIGVIMKKNNIYYYGNMNNKLTENTVNNLNIEN